MDFRIKVTPIRSLPRPEEKFRELVDRAPELEAWTERVAERLRPMLAWLFAARRRIATITIVLITAALFLHIAFGENGMVVYRQKREEYRSLQKELDGLQKENDQYTGDIKALKTDPSVMEKAAREQLHYARPGEVVYVAPAPVQAPPPANAETKK